MSAHRTTHRSISGLLVVAAILLNLARAQDYPVRTFTEADGLPHQSILGMAQTRDGLLWFSTLNGLATYDTRAFEAVTIDADIQPHRARYRIASDNDGTLWTFQMSPPYLGRRLVDSQWVLLPENELASDLQQPNELSEIYVEQRAGKHYVLLGTNGGHLFHYSPTGWIQVPSRLARIRSICVHNEHFVIAHDLGVHTLPITTPTVGLTRVSGLPDSNTMAVVADPRRDACWIVGRTWIAEQTKAGLIVKVPSMSELFYPDVIRVAALPDEHGGIYFGELAGFAHFDPQDGIEFFGRKNTLDDIGVTRLMRDREGIIWAGGVRGVAKFVGRTIINHSSKQGLAEDEVSAILELRDGRMVLGHGEHLTILENPPRIVNLRATAPFTRIMAMVQDPDGSILCAASRAGLLRVNPDTLAIERMPGPPLPNQPQDPNASTVQHVDQASNGDIVVAGWQRAWWHRQSGDELIDISSLKLGATYVRQIVVDGGSLLFAVRNLGVAQITDGDMRSWTSPEHILRNITCVKRRPDGALWAGTAGGAVRADDDGILRRIRFGDEIIRQSIYSMTDDHHGRTWFGTNNGVVIWDGTKLRHLTSHEGLVGRESNRGANICDSKGRMWIGFDHGVSTYYPEREHAGRFGPTVEFLPARVDGVLTSGNSWHALQERQSLAFRLRSISTRDEARLLHEYRLEGVDQDWSPRRSLPDGEVLYQSLAAGRYRLHVRVSDSGGMSSTAISPWIEVRPPWWRSWWFAASTAAAALLLFACIATYVSQSRQKHLLERTVLQRTTDLRIERNRLRAMLTNIADGVIGVDSSGTIIVWNPTASTVTGWTESYAVGRRLSDLLPTLNDGNSDGSHLTEVTIIDGQTRWFEFTAAAVTSDADSGRIIAFRDVTDRRQQERLLTRTERLESLGILAGGIAHDFNNLLTVMLGNLSLLELGDSAGSTEPEETEQLHDQIRDAVLRARDLTQQLLTFSKGGAPIRRLGSLAEAVTESTQLALSGANVRADISFDADWFDVEFDFGQVSQVIHNLVLNARQAMPTGGVVTVRGYNADCAPNGTMANFAVIEVRDTGIGIEPAALEHIFDPYYSTKPQGTGLGLATSHSIVQRHEGFLTAESRPGHGTVLRMHLPAAANKQSKHHLGSSNTAANACQKLKQHRILCMDDDAAIRSVLLTGISRLGHRALAVADGNAAIAAYRQSMQQGDAFDIVLLDLTIPGGMGGIETLQHLVSMQPDVIAIAATGYSTDLVRAEFQQHGFLAMLSKPFSIDDVRVALAQALQAANHGASTPNSVGQPTTDDTRAC